MSVAMVGGLLVSSIVTGRIISRTGVWKRYLVGGMVLVVVGHVSAIILAHDRAIVLYKNPKRAVRSQYWMLGVMIFFTTLALWLLSQLG